MITADIILENLRASSKKQVFQLMAEAAGDALIGKTADIFDALIEREMIGSTGIGHGVAVPHIKLVSLKKIYGVLARLEKPVDYDAMDRQPVDIVFMILAPSDTKTTLHLKALAQASRFLKDQEICAEIRASASQPRLESILNEWLKKHSDKK